MVSSEYFITCTDIIIYCWWGLIWLGSCDYDYDSIQGRGTACLPDQNTCYINVILNNNLYIDVIQERWCWWSVHLNNTDGRIEVL